MEQTSIQESSNLLIINSDNPNMDQDNSQCQLRIPTGNYNKKQSIVAV
jgi:hypothetical protein